MEETQKSSIRRSYFGAPFGVVTKHVFTKVYLTRYSDSNPYGAENDHGPVCPIVGLSIYKNIILTSSVGIWV